MLAHRAIFPLLALALCAIAVPARAASLTIACGSSPPAVELCRAGSEAWAQARGHEVRVLGYPEASNRARDLLAELLAAGFANLDVLEVDLVWPASLAPHLLDLTDRLEGAGPFFPAAVQSFSVEGRLLAAPWSLSVGRLFYRKDLLQRYRLPVPATWEELAASARQIQEGERAAGTGEFWGFVWQGRVGEGLTVNAMEWLASRGVPPIMDAGGDLSGLGRPDATVALDQAASWIDTISPGAVLAMGGPQSFEAFASGKAAFLRYWSSGLEITDAEGSAVRGLVGSADLPAGDAAGARGAGVLGGYGLAVARDSKHQDLALDLVRWLIGPDEQRRRADGGGYDPSLPALYVDPALVARWPHLPELRAAIDRAILRPTMAAGASYDALSSAFAEGVHGILGREVEAAAGLQALAQSLRRLAGLLLAVLLPGSLVAAPLARRELRVGAATSETPFAALDDAGEFQGFTIDVARALCRRLEVRCAFIGVDIYDPLRSLQDRSVDLITPVAITEARRRVLDFTESYFRSPGRLVVPRGRGLEPTAEALAERTVGVQRGTSQDRFASATFTRSTLRRYPDRFELFLDLALGRLDAALASAIAARADFLDTELGAGFAFSGPLLDDPTWFGEGVGIAVRKGDDQLRDALDGALRELRASGRLEAIRSRYPGFDIE